MSRIVSFEDELPPRRFDDIPWTQVQVEESASNIGTFVVIDTQDLDPVDSDPANPSFRNFTVEGTQEAGWYKVTWIDANGNFSKPQGPILNEEDETSSLSPNRDELGAMMRARTKDSYGNEIGTFDQNTRPTGVQVDDILAQAAGTVSMELGDVPDALVPRARYAVLLLAAMLVELSYYPEQFDNAQSTYAGYLELYNSTLAALKSAVSGNQAGGSSRIYNTLVLGDNGEVQLESDLEEIGWYPATYPTRYPWGY